MANNNSNGVYIPIEDPNYPGRKTDYKFYTYEELEQLSKKLGLKKSIAETIKSCAVLYGEETSTGY